MGRDSGFIAHYASRDGNADVCLIPEMGQMNVLEVMAKVDAVLTKKGNCVVCVAEGFHIAAPALCDALGTVSSYVKYIDPSYLLRGGICTAEDREFCYKLGVAAVDAAIQGLSGVTVATSGGKMTHFLTKDIIRTPKRVIM